MQVLENSKFTNLQAKQGNFFPVPLSSHYESSNFCLTQANLELLVHTLLSPEVPCINNKHSLNFSGMWSVNSLYYLLIEKGAIPPSGEEHKTYTIKASFKETRNKGKPIEEALLSPRIRTRMAGDQPKPQLCRSPLLFVPPCR